MMIIRFWKYTIISVLLLVSCNKEGAGCFDKAGNIKTLNVDIAPFTTIDVASNINVQILTTGADRVEITAGENLISGISLKVENEVLKIDNLNTCFWTRGYVSPLVSIRNANLEKVLQHGYGRIYSSDTLKIEDLMIHVQDASGAVDLLIDANYVRVVSNNIGPITLTGNVDRLDVGYYWSDGILYASELKVQDCSVDHKGSNRMEVNAVNSLKGSINSIGSVYLFGQKPVIVDVELNGEGKVVEKF